MIKELPKLVEGMTEDRFWELVEMAQWGKSYDYNKIKVMYLKKLSKEECQKFRSMKTVASNALYDMSTKDITGVGDDSYSDLLNHIIGLGREEYYKHLNSFDLIQKRADKGEYHESFSYCIPYDSDYEENTQYSIKHIQKMAKESSKIINEFVKMDGGIEKPQYLRPILKELADIDMLMQNFLDNPTLGGLEELIEAKSWIKKATEKVGKFFIKNRMDLPRKFTDNGQGGMSIYLFQNTVYDAEKVLEYLK